VLGLFSCSANACAIFRATARVSGIGSVAESALVSSMPSGANDLLPHEREERLLRGGFDGRAHQDPGGCTGLERLLLIDDTFLL
jgi:hypothetical protein